MSFTDRSELSPQLTNLLTSLANNLTLVVQIGKLARTARDAALIREREQAMQERAAELNRINALLLENSRSMATAITRAISSGVGLYREAGVP